MEKEEIYNKNTMLPEKEEDAPMDFRVGLGIHFVEREAGHARAEMEICPCHMNVLGVIHGGVLFSLADTTSGASVAGYGTRVTTVNGTINYLKAGKDTAKITSEAQVVKHGKTFSVTDCRVYDDKGQLLVTTTMTFYHLTDR